MQSVGISKMLKRDGHFPFQQNKQKTFHEENNSRFLETLTRRYTCCSFGISHYYRYSPFISLKPTTAAWRM